MEAIEGAQQVSWFGDEFDLSPEDIMREEEEDDEKFPAAPRLANSPVDSQPEVESIINRLITAVYSGPTLGDVESLLCGATTNARCSYPPPMVCVPEKGLGKMEHKYTLRIKTCGNGLADDGYKWRKYGQKSIKNSPNPRSYYRCTNPRCNAKKQVERSTEEPEMLVVTYEGLHLHYTYSHLLLRRPPPPPPNCSAAGLHVAKKLKSQPTMTVSDDDKDAAERSLSFAGDIGGARTSPPAVGLLLQGSDPVSCGSCDNDNDDGGVLLSGVFEHDAAMRGSSEGLLEDVVPLLVRRPCSSTTSSSSPASSPSYSSLSWTADSSSYPDLGGLSSIVL